MGNNKRLTTGPEGIVNFVSRESQCFPRLPRESQIRALSSRHFQSRSVHVQYGVRRSTCAGNSALLPTDVIDFAMLPTQRLLPGNSFIVRCHVASK